MNTITTIQLSRFFGSVSIFKLVHDITAFGTAKVFDTALVFWDTYFLGVVLLAGNLFSVSISTFYANLIILYILLYFIYFRSVRIYFAKNTKPMYERSIYEVIFDRPLEFFSFWAFVVHALFVHIKHLLQCGFFYLLYEFNFIGYKKHFYKGPFYKLSIILIKETLILLLALCLLYALNYMFL